MDDHNTTLHTLLSAYAPTGKAAEETLHAIVLGEADALVIETADGPRVYTLKDANEPYRRLVERMSDAALVADPDGTIYYSNGRLAALLGHEGLVGRGFLDLVAWDERCRAERLLLAAAEFQSSAEITLISSLGETVAVRVAAAPLEFDRLPCVALVVTPLDDIAALKASEAALRDAKTNIEDILASIDDGFYAVDDQWRFSYMNARACEVFGLAVEDVLGRSFAEVFPHVVGHELFTRFSAAMAARTPQTFDAIGPITGRWMAFSAYPRSRGGLSVYFRDISERKGAEVALKAAKAEAERAVLSRSKFLAAASHDLRQPVQSLVLLLGVLKQQELAPKVGKAVGLMENALEGLNGLLSSILDLSRLDAGVVMPQVEPVDIGALLRRLGLEYTLLAAGKGLRMAAAGPALVARTDPALLERLVRNLIENAIRYTEAGGIVLGVRCRGDRVRLDVVDSGIGIAADKLPHIFEEFFQVGNSGRERNHGLGLGLSIVSRLARLLGTEVQVRSREGHGTCFTLMLPLDAALCQPAAIASTDGSGTLLIIEDDGAVRMGLQLLIESWGHRVVAVASGEEALEVCGADARRFDLIVADHRLGPGLNGTDAALAIRRQAGRPIPTLVVTGDTAPERISDVYASGFDILHKPVAAEELRHKLAQLLRGGVKG